MKNHRFTEEVKKQIAACLRMYAEHPSLTKEYNEHKPEWNDEKSLNETLAAIVRTIEDINVGTLKI